MVGRNWGKSCRKNCFNSGLFFEFLDVYYSCILVFSYWNVHVIYVCLYIYIYMSMLLNIDIYILYIIFYIHYIEHYIYTHYMYFNMRYVCIWHVYIYIYILYIYIVYIYIYILYILYIYIYIILIGVVQFRMSPRPMRCGRASTWPTTPRFSWSTPLPIQQIQWDLTGFDSDFMAFWWCTVSSVNRFLVVMFK